MSSPVADKIRKLIAHERSARNIGNLAEAEAFASKVQDLLLEHKLSMSELEDQANPLGSEVGSPTKPLRRGENWSYRLARAVCDACFCKVAAARGTNRLVFIGREVDRSVAVEMWRFLRDLALEFAVDDVQRVAKVRRKMSPASIRTRYLTGFAVAIGIRLAMDRRSAEVRAGSEGLVLLNRAIEAVHEFQQAHVPTRQATMAKTHDSLAYRAGFTRGLSAPLKRQGRLGAGA